MPRAALLSIHARVLRASSTIWEHPSLVQLWGPRFSDYLVSAQDLAVFSLGRLPEDIRRRARAQETASRLHAFLDGRRMPFGQAGREIGVSPNSLRYAAPTGSVLLRWDGSRQPVVWTVPPPAMDPWQARLELARRYLHIYGPATPESFSRWAGIGSNEAIRTFKALADTLTPARTPVGDAWILADDEQAFRSKPGPAAPARLLPSGDAYLLCYGEAREKSSYLNRSDGPSCGRRASGRELYWCVARSLAYGAARRPISRSTSGAVFPRQSGRRSRPRRCRFRCAVRLPSTAAPTPRLEGS